MNISALMQAPRAAGRRLNAKDPLLKLSGGVSAAFRTVLFPAFRQNA